MICCALTNLSENNEINKTPISNSKIVSRLLELQHHPHPQARLHAFNTVASLIALEENAQDVADQKQVQGLLEIVVAAKEDGESLAAAEVLKALTELKNFRTSLHYLVPSLLLHLHKVKDQEISLSLLTILSNISDLDSVLPNLFEERKLFTDFAKSESIDFKIRSAFILGNLARGDENCVKLMDEGIVSVVLNLIETADARVQHSGLGIVRNLSISAGHRQILAEAGIIQKLINLLGSRNAHVLFAVIGILRHFLVLGDSICQDFIQRKGLTNILPFATELNLEEHKRIVYETARVLAALIISLNDPEPVLKEKEVLKPIVQLVQSDYEVLQLEGARALSRIADFEEHRNELAEIEGVAEAVAKLVASKNEGVSSGSLDSIEKLVLNERLKQSFKGVENLTIDLQSSSVPQDRRDKLLALFA
eukprot:TRINITY_DN3298_c0_g1_i1.p1 TRINITY_DN3298_c0_g1~~TRINITY_DN3298_c0_g1_i1.p1  ORF type:complete len:423 (+),score=106.66 TRINITY_DN3298_c0_g1_i1:537-1805(+)